MQATKWFRDHFLGNIGLKVISVLIAIVLWIVVLGSRDIEISKEVPIEIVAPTDHVASNEIPDRVTFRLSGPKAFMRTLADRKESPIRINLATAKAGLITHRFFPDSIRLPMGVKLLSINPPAILINLETMRTRTSNVRVDFRGELPPGLKLERWELIPPTVKIKGARSRIVMLDEVLTQPVELSEMKESSEKVVQLDLNRIGVELDGPAPLLKIDVRTDLSNFRIRNIGIRVLLSAGMSVSTQEKSLTVFVKAPSDIQRALDASTVFAEVDLRGRPAGKYEEIPRIVLPKNAELVKITPDRVHLDLKN